LGLRLRRSAYQEEVGVEPGTANRDLKATVKAGLLEARGETRGRYYLGTDLLRRPYFEIRAESRQRIFDPYEALPEIPSGPIQDTLEQRLF
jgi:DNA-binding transcriptional ArsR family regulator